MKRYAVREQWIDLSTSEARRPMQDRSDSFDDKQRALDRAQLLRQDGSRIPEGYLSEVIVIDRETGALVYDERIVTRTAST